MFWIVRFVDLTANDFSVIAVVRALVCFSSASLSARTIPVAYSYRNVFDVVLCCALLFVHLLARVLFRLFLCFFARLFFRYFGPACIGLFFLCTVVVSVHLRCAMCVGVICL